jgi:hypothetical protein
LQAGTLEPARGGAIGHSLTARRRRGHVKRVTRIGAGRSALPPITGITGQERQVRFGP